MSIFHLRVLQIYYKNINIFLMSENNNLLSEKAHNNSHIFIFFFWSVHWEVREFSRA